MPSQSRRRKVEQFAERGESAAVRESAEGRYWQSGEHQLERRLRVGHAAGERRAAAVVAAVARGLQRDAGDDLRGGLPRLAKDDARATRHEFRCERS